MDIKAYIDSGILQMYILGYATDEECVELEKLKMEYPEIEEALRINEIALAEFSEEVAVEPHETLKPLVLATYDYIARLESGEEFKIAPTLSAESKVEDFQEWIDREDMSAPNEFDNLYVKLITAMPGFTCGMVWINQLAPDEVHSDEFERFLILEGTCTIHVEEKEYRLKRGDYFQIPLHLNHQVIVTSTIPCKVILQRVAA